MYNISQGQSIKQILQSFYKESGLPPDGGIEEPRVKIIIAKHFSIYIPNFNARRKAVLKHDIHHLLTGYYTDFKGETEISAWEIGSGCRNYWAAWALDMQGLMLGLFFNLRGVYNAFIRGRHSMNLYSDMIDNGSLVNMTTSEILSVIIIPPKNAGIAVTLKDIISFFYNLIIGGVYSIASLLLVPFLIIYNVVLLSKT